VATTPLPRKEELPQQLFDVATTLTTEAQNAALKKARELGFNLDRGRISLEETLINLNQAREILVDAVEKRKLVQLPLKLQYSLLAQTQRVSQSLSGLIAGTDAVEALEDSVDDLTASIWQYNLQNLSGEVLGFTQKMNQLKSQETLIRQVHRQAEAFVTAREQAERISEQLSEINTKAQDAIGRIEKLNETADLSASQVGKTKDLVDARLLEIEKIKSSTSDVLRTSEEAAEKIASASTESEEAKKAIDETHASLSVLLGSFSVQLEDTKSQVDDLLSEVRKNQENSATEAKAEIAQAIKDLTDSITTLGDSASGGLQQTTNSLDNSIKLLRTEVSDLVSNTDERLKAAEANQSKMLEQALDTFDKQRDLKLEEVSTEFRTAAAAVETDARTSVSKNDRELHRLTGELKALEDRIRDSIERATGYTLFHSFQKRQEDLAKEKKFWARALATAVGVSVCASLAFIISLHWVQVYNAAFYLKLSISLPIIYAVAFCSLQYSRERRLEEEYAFKSSISISLDPYQRLVKQLVDQDKPEELAKYTQFVIDSVNRVFTSPTERIFDEHHHEKGTSPEKLLKGLREFLEPLLSVIKK
jgi:hypothetical protein